MSEPERVEPLNPAGLVQLVEKLQQQVADLEHPCVEPTDNRAERALRPAVIARKLSQCSKNRRGADAFEAFASMTRTLVQRGSSPIDGMVAVLQGTAPRP